MSYAINMLQSFYNSNFELVAEGEFHIEDNEDDLLTLKLGAKVIGKKIFITLDRPVRDFSIVKIETDYEPIICYFEQRKPAFIFR